MRSAMTLVAMLLLAAPAAAAQSGATGVRTDETSGMSAAGTEQPAQPQPEGKRARQILSTSHAGVSLPPEARDQIRAYFARHQVQHIDHVDFSITIGAAVPHQAKLQPLPADLADAMGKYKGDDYLLVRNQLVIVEPRVRRIVAIIPDAAS